MIGYYCRLGAYGVTLSYDSVLQTQDYFGAGAAAIPPQRQLRQAFAFRPKQGQFM